MDQATLQSKVARGYAKAAMRLGAETQQYRPSSLTDPMASVYATLMAAFNNSATFTFQQPTPWGRPAVFGLFDTSDVQAGDILVSGSDTYFVDRFEAFQPAALILCNNTLTISGGLSGSSGAADSAACALLGYQPGYSGMPATSAAPLTGAWPCYLGLKGRGKRADSGIPGSISGASYEIFLPLMPGFAPTAYMTASDSRGIGYTIEAVEISPYGYRCDASIQQG